MAAMDLPAQGVRAISKNSDVLLAVAVVGVILLLIIPLPPIMMDLLLSMSIILAVTTLLITLYTDDALAFNAFPSLLLFLTLFRLSLNIASTRMILAQGDAGDIIKTFGDFVTGGNLVVGLVIFILLTVVNFVVITKGSGRIAEVAARFTLDAMPGKQMSIDADLNAGIIDEDQARSRRERITAEAEFYGSMDGASKFVRGDAIAGIVITAVNIVGGFAIGLAFQGLGWAEAAETYMTLSVGDGLVSQIPALLISVGAGVIVTRASSDENLGKTFNRQMFNNPKVLYVSAGIIGVMALVPGMPAVVMLPIAIVIALYAYALSNGAHQVADPILGDLDAPEAQEDAPEQEEAVEKVLFVDPMEVELGYGLIPLVDTSQGGDLLNRITVIRRQIASELGVVTPPVRIRDNMTLESDIYVIKIKGIEVARGSLQVDSYLAMNPGNALRKIQGIDTIEPAFGLPAVWISAAQKETAEMYGYTVVDALSVLATHLTEVVHAHADELLNRQETQRLVDNAKEYASAVVEELIPTQLTLGQVLKVLQNLLKERIPIRDIVSILETLADYSHDTKDADILTEYVRQGLARTISHQYGGDERKLYTITLDPKVEQMLAESLQKNEFGTRIVVRPATVTKIAEQLNAMAQQATDQGEQAVVLLSPSLRPYFKRLIDHFLPRLPILSFNEITNEVEVHAIGAVGSDVLM